MNQARKNYKYSSESARTGVAKTLGSAIREMLSHYRLDRRVAEASVLEAWPRLMGAPIASRTERLWIKDRTLFLVLNSAPLRQQLMLSQRKLIEMLNREAGVEVIDEVVFL